MDNPVQELYSSDRAGEGSNSQSGWEFERSEALYSPDTHSSSRMMLYIVWKLGWDGMEFVNEQLINILINYYHEGPR